VSVVRLQKEISELSTAQRLEAMEALWASLAKDQQDIESPEWHRKVLDARQANVNAGKGEFLTVGLLKERLRR
jgi:putative addiction module component (TIGR02574 family)